jgi:Spy/CpxP family protein refolding chaperone
MKKLFGTLLLLFMLISITCNAQPMKGKGGMFNHNIKTMLKLTPEQEKQFDDITYKNEQTAIDIKAKIQKNRLDLKKMISDKNLDESKTLQLIDENSKLQSEMKHDFAKRWIDIYKILNDDQKAIFMKGLSHLIDGVGRMGDRMGMEQDMMGMGRDKMHQGMRGKGMMWNQGMRTDKTRDTTNN